MRTSESQNSASLELRRFIDHVPALGWSALPDGSLEYVNQLFRDYTGVSPDQLYGSGWKSAIHRDDMQQFEAWWQSLSHGQEAGTTAVRIRRLDGEYRWFQIAVWSVRDEQGNLVRGCAICTDIDELKRSEQKVRRDGADLTIIDAIPIGISVLAPDGKAVYVNQMALDRIGVSLDEVRSKGHLGLTCHPDDLDRVIDERRIGLSGAVLFALEMRLLRYGDYRWCLVEYNPLKDESGRVIRWYATATDIDDRKRAEQELKKSEKELLTITDSIANPIGVLAPDGTVLYANQVLLNESGLSLSEAMNGFYSRSCHPHDIERAQDERLKGLREGVPFELEMRLVKYGQYRWHVAQYNPLKDERGQIIRWYVTATDIEDRKHAEERLRQSEQDLRTITDAIRQVIVVIAPDGTTLYANRVALDASGLTMEQAEKEGFLARICHPDDVDRLRGRQEGLLRGVPFEVEARALRHGEYRWQLVQYDPLKDQSGQIIRWYATATDIEDQKKREERLRNENLVLREDVDRSSMFEEIVGSCKAMREVLRQVEKVAPSDSTVLILGETGTGKELIARALHRRSRRANRAFVKVNCAAIPESLIASELFGHEKGAFTGALQRRVGRFEAADGGTLFLDEVGDLPMETQIALLRVLQEKEFERVGSNHPISVNVRLIAATNRDLPAAVADGTFRQDLFYRLNVFPIAVPPLCERVDDIPLLVEYFVGRFAKGAGKNIRHISKQTLEQLKGYDWPGNIRELQNVVERAVILCEDDTFVVDESWLKRAPAGSPRSQDGLSALADREVEMIEAALAEAHGRISGPTGAAAKLGIPRQTLESKIRRLGIDRYGQKRPASN